MSQENVDAVRRGYELLNARLELSQELFAPDYELDVTDASPDFVEAIRGVEATQKMFREYWGTFEDFHVDVEEVIHADQERVITAVRDGGHMKASDTEGWKRFFHVYTFDQGKVVRLSIHTDRKRALEARAL